MLNHREIAKHALKAAAVVALLLLPARFVYGQEPDTVKLNNIVVVAKSEGGPKPITAEAVTSVVPDLLLYPPRDYFISVTDLVSVTDTLPQGPIICDNIPAAIRTNLLLPGLNAGVEIPVGAHSSLEADIYWPWVWPKWLSSDNDRCIEALAARVGYRFWPLGHRSSNGKTDLTGLSFGINVIGGYFDFEWDYEGAQGEAFAAGVDITYAIPIAHRRLRLELTVGAGYGYIQYREYKVYSPGGVLIRPASLPVVRGWIPVPTNAAISLVIPVYGKTKGGGR